ncbi:Ketopantoate reductase ApbA/PanE [Penicillium sp. IBT 16267x]|nr:Ketopantoate reductase ApbA/PanE [Penicillium sp. IBT 16267x]
MVRYASAWMNDAEDVSRETTKAPLSGRVHILGLGNVGCFIAHALASRQSRPPVTLLLHNWSIYQAFRRKKKSISLQYNGLDDIKTGFDVEVLSDGVWHEVLKDETRENIESDIPLDQVEDISTDVNYEHIECLIVTSKASVAKTAIKSVKHRLTKDSTIVLVQNGMGVVEMLNHSLFPDPEDRPTYVQGVVSHGLTRIDKFHIAHLGVGTMVFAPTITENTPALLAEDDTHWAPTTKYILRLLAMTPSLVATTDTPAALLQYQLEKLAVNCLINPLTALNDCTNGELLYVFDITRIMRLLLFEISSVIYALPELQGVPGIEERFSPERLRRITVAIASATSKNTSSMLQDLRSGNDTEIDHMNGWVMKRGEELGIKCALNYMIRLLIKSKGTIRQRRGNASIPLAIDGVPSVDEFADQITTTKGK